MNPYEPPKTQPQPNRRLMDLVGNVILAVVWMAVGMMLALWLVELCVLHHILQLPLR